MFVNDGGQSGKPLKRHGLPAVYRSLACVVLRNVTLLFGELRNLIPAKLHGHLSFVRPKPATHEGFIH
jgi:hypothetical protein